MITSSQTYTQSLHIVHFPKSCCFLVWVSEWVSEVSPHQRHWLQDHSCHFLLWLWCGQWSLVHFCPDPSKRKKSQHIPYLQPCHDGSNVRQSVGSPSTHLALGPAHSLQHLLAKLGVILAPGAVPGVHGPLLFLPGCVPSRGIIVT